VLGERITYADFVVYQILHDEGMTKEGRKGLEELPRLRSLVEEIEGRERVRAFLESERYLG
jgi:prostaglandin-H2 D-isomerase / glutathione transferase